MFPRRPPVAWLARAMTPANEGVDADVPPISITTGSVPEALQSPEAAL